MIRRAVLVILILAILGAGVWAALRYKRLRDAEIPELNALQSANTNSIAWAAAVEQVKADRGELATNGPALEVPQELKHYSDRYWFLATQIAEIAKYNVPTCQDYVDLAEMIERAELVSVPGVTDTYVLYGVGQRADDSVFTRADPANTNFQPLEALAKNFAGRSYNLNDPADRQALKGNMLSSLRPAALKVLEEVASAYRKQFGRPLPISSLIRPEQYQQALRRVNRNAVVIETPPHSTGLAFDIDYRYMSAAEQNFVMAELARLKNEGRIEAIRERNANYHVFAFLNGTRPSDDLISAKLDEAVPPGREANHADDKEKPAKAKTARSKSTKKPQKRVQKRRGRR
ncbi:MAG TPA: DUF5715 family protein [Pyrinomonadaceae bacterium]|nr:DUF5715 family protein [Pyrinomonadaceae bacterium]